MERSGAALEQANSAFQEARRELAKAHDEAASDRQALVNRSREDLALIQSEHAGKRASWAAERQELIERLETARYEAGGAMSRYEGAEARATTLTVDLGSSQDQLSEATSAGDRLAGVLEATRAQEGRLSGQLAQLQDALKTAEEWSVSADARAKAAGARVQVLEAEVSELRRSLKVGRAQSNERSAMADAEASELRAALVAERAARASADGQLATLTKAVVADLVAVRAAVEAKPVTEKGPR